MENLNLTGRTKHDTPDELATLSVVMIDGDEMYIDQGAIHGKSKLERGVDFRSFAQAEDVPNGRLVHEVWVTLKRYEAGMGYNGAVATYLVLNNEGQGYKSMAGLVNSMDGAMKGKINLTELAPEQKARFVAFLQEMRGDLWANTPQEVKDQLQ